MTTYARIDLAKYIVISIWFGCNNHCAICMLSALKQKMPAIGFDRFRKALIDIRNHGKYKNLILSGAEVTTFDDLEKYVQFAASLGWFDKIQIQTNGRNLSNKDYLARLIDCGVNEFFISIYGLEEVHDSMTCIRGSFIETMEGLKNLEAFDVNVISNTVLTKTNYHDMVRLVTSLSRKKISEIHLWNFFPMGKTDSKDFVVSMKNVSALIPKIFTVTDQAGKPLVMKSFPECLSCGKPWFFDSGFPETLLPNMFWETFSQNDFGMCVHRNTCRTKTCWGLSRAYIQKYGNERNLLSPIS